MFSTTPFPDSFLITTRRKGLVLVEDDVASTTTEVSAEQTIKYLTRVVPRPALDASAAPAKLEVAYEDDHIAAIVKPQGMPTITMGKRMTSQPSATECIKYFLTMPAIPGATCPPQPLPSRSLTLQVSPSPLQDIYIFCSNFASLSPAPDVLSVSPRRM